MNARARITGRLHPASLALFSLAPHVMSAHSLHTACDCTVVHLSQIPCTYETAPGFDPICSQRIVDSSGLYELFWSPRTLSVGVLCIQYGTHYQPPPCSVPVPVPVPYFGLCPTPALLLLLGITCCLRPWCGGGGLRKGEDFDLNHGSTLVFSPSAATSVGS